MIAVYIHPKNSNHLRSHLRAIMALDHSRLGLENKFLENKSGRIFFAFDKFIIYFAKSCQQVWGGVNQPFILFIHHIWGETVLFIIQTSDRMRHFTIFQDKLHLVNIQDDQSWAFSETVQKISKITHTASRFSFLVRAAFVWSSVWMNFNRLMLQHNNEFIIIFFCYLMVSVITMCNLIKRLIRTTFLSTPASDVYERWKQTAQTSD